MGTATVTDVAEFHYRDCARPCAGRCTDELRAGNADVLGAYDRMTYLNDIALLGTVFAGRYEDPSSWRRVAVATAAAVAPPEDDDACPHFVRWDEWCDICSGAADPEPEPIDAVAVELWGDEEPW